MSDSPELPPVPRYGEYAPGYGPGAQRPATPPPPAASSWPAAQQPKPRGGDRTASVLLLVVGFFASMIAIANALTLGQQMQLVYDEYGVEAAYQSGPAEATAAGVIIVSHIVLYGITLFATLALMRAGRRAFWLPLVAGVVAVLIVIVTITVFMVNDPNLMRVLMEQAEQLRQQP
jgi:hypothetical protein